MTISVGLVATASDVLALAQATYGSYSGNSVASRIIAHGLADGTIPSLVHIVNTTDFGHFSILRSSNTNIFYFPGGTVSNSIRANTGMDTTNFYVGGTVTTAPEQVANLSTHNYSWVAIG